jgi:hypothetical protein
MKSADPASSLCFSNKSSDYFDVTVETPSLKATKKVSIYDYGPTDRFIDFFRRLASHTKPWMGEETWEPLESGIKLTAKCDALGHVELKIAFEAGFSSSDNWSLECFMLFDFGMLSDHAANAKKFSEQRSVG